MVSTSVLPKISTAWTTSELIWSEQVSRVDLLCCNCDCTAPLKWLSLFYSTYKLTSLHLIKLLIITINLNDKCVKYVCKFSIAVFCLRWFTFWHFQSNKRYNDVQITAGRLMFHQNFGRCEPVYPNLPNYFTTTFLMKRAIYIMKNFHLTWSAATLPCERWRFTKC